MSARGRAAAKLVKPVFGRRKIRRVFLDDGLPRLKFRARLRGAALGLRPINAIALGLSLLLLYAAETPQSLALVIGFALSGFLLERLADGPKTRRRPRIVRDLRPILLQRTIIVPEPRRAARILRARPSPIELALPPSRPRSRIVERRPAPLSEDSE